MPPLFGRVGSHAQLRRAEAALHRRAAETWRKDAPEVGFEISEVAGDVHTVSYLGPKRTAKRLLCLHGFGSASGIYATSLPLMASRWGACDAIDMPGCGLSRRDRSWAHLTRSEAENVVTTSMEAWRRAIGNPQLVLVAHSVSAHFATAYAERHCDAVDALVLASPAGLAATSNKATGLIPFVWRNLSPFSLVRAFPETGRRLIEQYVDNRFNDKTQIKSQLADYIYYNVMASDASLGSKLHSLFLHPPTRGGPQFGINPLEARLANLDLPIAFVFGDRDWVKDHAALRLAGRRRDISVAYVSDAGHNLMIDNPRGFADTVLTAVGLQG